MDGIAASPIGCKFSSRSLFQQEKRAIEGMLTGTITKGCQNISDLSSSFQEIQQKKGTDYTLIDGNCLLAAFSSFVNL